MQFKADAKETVILDPNDDLRRKTIPSEIRYDPLTGRSARICHFMQLHWEKPDFEALVAGTEKICPFCPDKITRITPSFPPDLVAEGRLAVDDLLLFPNIAPYDSVGAIATFGGRHFIPMADFSAPLIAKAFGLAMEFFRRVQAAGHPESVYHLINWNYMPAAGSSLIHPHLQVFATSSAPNLMREELAAARRYRAENGSCYWEDLVAAESAAGERLLGRIGRTTWLSAFAPMGVAGDVLAVVDGATCTLELSEADLADLAEGLARTMAAYDRMGIYNFNMSFFTGARGDDFTRLHLSFSPRTYFNQSLGATDVNALRHLYNETLCLAPPEEINGMLRRFFT